MTPATDDMDLQRRRWKNIRVPLRLVDVAEEQFATGGHASRVPDLTYRLLILPTDPEGHKIDFNESFWKAWMSLKAPDSDRPLSSCMTKCPTSAAAVRCDSNSSGNWNRFMALHHSGALEIGSGRATGVRVSDDSPAGRRDRSQFFLLPIVDFTRLGCFTFATFATDLQLSPPFELTLALRGTGSACLGGFARGWEEPGQSFPDEVSICREPNLLLKREILSVTDNWPEAISESLAVQIENGFGSTAQRFRPVR